MVSSISYQDFDLRIVRAGGAYRAQADSPAGQAAASFSLPFSDLELENFLLRVGRTRRATRRMDSPEVQAAKTFGERLFASVFAHAVQACLQSSLDGARRQGGGLRLRLHLTEAPELADLPWEYLYNPALNRFLGLSVETPLIRYLDLPEPVAPLSVTPPLRVLVMISSPADYPALDVEREHAKLRESLDTLERRGLVTMEVLAKPRLSALQQALRRGTHHIFHFIGHGGFDTAAQDGVLVLEGEGRQGQLVNGQDLGLLLHDHRALRLAVLNACEGARSSRTDPFAGAAQSLVQQGVPAVIAMQFEITDEAAIAFAQEFYGAVADGYPVDAALGEARKAIFTQGNALEWGTPVLHMRAPDGRIFDVEKVPGQKTLPSQERAERAGPIGSGRSWGIPAGATVLLPVVNLLTKALPLGMWGEGGGGFAYLSPHLVTTIATLMALITILWSYARRRMRSDTTPDRFILKRVVLPIAAGGLALLVYLIGSSLVAGDFYFRVLGWLSDNQLRVFGDLVLLGCYSVFFSSVTRVIILLADRPRRT